MQSIMIHDALREIDYNYITSIAQLFSKIVHVGYHIVVICTGTCPYIIIRTVLCLKMNSCDGESTQ